MKGFSTLELLIAMTIMMMTFTAVILTTFGNQSLILGGQTNAEAMNKAQDLLESAQAAARRDFNLVNATSSIPDSIYTKSVSVQLLPDFLTKEVTARIDWKDDHLSPRNLTLTTLIANFENVAGGSTCNSSPSGDWKNPTMTYNTLASLGAPSNPVAAIDAYKNMLYVGTGPTGAATDKTLLTFSLSPGGAPTYLGGVDTSGSTLTKGPNAIHVVATTTNGRVYAYLANSNAPNWNSLGCWAPGPACSDLQVVDVTNPAAPTVVTNFKFATSSASNPAYYTNVPYVTAAAGQAIPQSLFYRNGYIYLGLSATGGAGPEFSIIDVHNPLSPTPVGSYSVGWGVESIYVRGSYAYLATDDKVGGVIKILNLNNPVTPTLVTALLGSSFGIGNALYMVGDTLYVGKAYNGGSAELSLFNSPNPGAATPTQLSIAPGTGIVGSTVKKLMTRDYLMYDLSTAGFEIRSATTTAPWATALSLPAIGSTFDCENNTFYVGTTGGGISVITAP